MRKVLIVLAVLLVGGLIAADRIGVMVAENQIGKRVQDRYNLPHQPGVSIGGFPFLTQAIAGKYDSIEVSIGDWTTTGSQTSVTNGQPVTVHDLHVKLSGLSASLSDVAGGNVNAITADSATATAVIPYDAIRQQSPSITSMSYDNGGLKIKGTFHYHGFTIPGTAVVVVKAGPNGIQVVPTSVQGDVGPPIPVALVASALTLNVPVRNLPIGSHITDAQATPDGLKVSATASNVHFSDLPTA
jgi:hypothetical protein